MVFWPFSIPVVVACTPALLPMELGLAAGTDQEK